VEALYDCALSPEHWPGALRLVGEITHSSSVVVLTLDQNKKSLVHSAGRGFDTDPWTFFLDKYFENPLIERLGRKAIGEIYTLASAGNLDEYRKGRFYDAWIRPHSFGDLMGVNGARSGLAVNRHDDYRSPYGKENLEVMRRLAPHVCRVFAISDALDLKTLRAQFLESTLDALTTAVYLTDREARIIYLNGAAERQIETGNALKIVRGRLAPVNHLAREAIGAAIEDAIADEAAMPRTDIALALSNGENGGLVATVLPLDRGERYGVVGSFAAAVAVFIQDPTLAPVYPSQAFAKLYGLTGAELRVLLAMAPGLGIKETAAILGIGEVTARTHLQHVYFKTGTSKQTELLNLLKDSTPPIRVA
jgi:DNA-binding CsgD family transcriptional regulator